MKKLSAFCIAGILCFCVTGTVFASGIDQGDASPKGTTITQDSDPKEADTTLTTSKGASYIVVIPEQAEISFDREENPIGEIEYVKGNLEPGAYVTVALSKKTPLENKADDQYTIPYEVCLQGEPFEQVVYDELTAAETKTALTVNITKENWEKAKAGDYKASLTFSISYTNPHENDGE